MTRAEVAQLLAMAASFDRRTVGETDVSAWSTAIGDLPFQDCQQVLVAHYRENRSWLMPSDVYAGVKKIRKQRLAETPDPTPPDDLDDEQQRVWLADVRQQIGDGVYEAPDEPVLEARDVQVAELVKRLD